MEGRREYTEKNGTPMIEGDLYNWSYKSIYNTVETPKHCFIYTGVIGGGFNVIYAPELNKLTILQEEGDNMLSFFVENLHNAELIVDACFRHYNANVDYTIHDKRKEDLNIDNLLNE